MTNETKEKIREEFEQWCKEKGITHTPIGDIEVVGCSGDVTQWWLSKLDLAVKEERARLVKKIEEIIKEKKEEDLQLKNTDQISAGFIKAQKIGCLSALYDIISLINQDK